MTMENAWMWFRIVVGVMMLIMLAYLVFTKTFNAELITQLLMLLIGILEAGSGALAFRAGRKIANK